VNVTTPTKALPLGARFTIAGVKVVGPGRFIFNCKPGEETVFVNSKQPSVFVLGGPADAKRG
jgi:hypothetical protein